MPEDTFSHGAVNFIAVWDSIFKFSRPFQSIYFHMCSFARLYNVCFSWNALTRFVLLSITRRLSIHFILKSGHIEYELCLLQIRTNNICLACRGRYPLGLPARAGSCILCSVWLTGVITWIQQNDPAHDKTYNKACAISADSDQPAHPRSLIRAFAERMRLLQPLGYPKRDKREPLPYWMDIQADLSLS